MLAEEKKKICDAALQEYLTSGKSIRELNSAHLGVTRDFIGGYFLGKGIDIYTRKNHINDHIFDIIDTEEKAYWLGFLYADGNISLYNKSWKIELTLQEQDLEHLKKYSKFLDLRKEPVYRAITKAYRVSISSRRVAEQLISKGCIPKKSLVLKFPSHSIVPKELMRHFIRGYFDGDGCISLRHNVYSTVPEVSLLGTKEFLEGLIEESNINDCTTVKKDKRSLSNTYNLQWHKKGSYEFLDYMYKDSTIYLQRKYDRYLLSIKEK